MNFNAPFCFWTKRSINSAFVCDGNILSVNNNTAVRTCRCIGDYTALICRGILDSQSVVNINNTIAALGGGNGAAVQIQYNALFT